jgi:hypothetical protein
MTNAPREDPRFRVMLAELAATRGGIYASARFRAAAVTRTRPREAFGLASRAMRATGSTFVLRTARECGDPGSRRKHFGKRALVAFIARRVAGTLDG